MAETEPKDNSTLLHRQKEPHHTVNKGLSITNKATHTQAA